MNISETLAIAQQLIRKPSVSPDDAGCQDIIGQYLQALGFQVEELPFGEVSNLWASRSGTTPGPLFCFAGHTDVVPPGPVEAWEIDPYAGEVVDGVLHGRGAADMKGSLAAMLTATSRFIESQPEYAGQIGFLITSDEEDVAVDGTLKVMQELGKRECKIDYCIVGEPSSSETVGDVVRVGRRGSLNGTLIARGIQGHVAYPDEANNPIHHIAPVIRDLTIQLWDEGNEFFPATSFQISNIHAGTGVKNVVPGELVLNFNFRFSTESTKESLQKITEDIIASHIDDYAIEWRLSGEPFLTTHGDLIPAVQRVIKSATGIDTDLSTSGGTSDGRFIAPLGTQVVELGPTNSTIHKVNEQIHSAELDQLSELYEQIMQELLAP